MLIQKNCQVSISFVAVKRPEVTNCHRGNKTELKHVQAESMLICPLSWCSLTVLFFLSGDGQVAIQAHIRPGRRITRWIRRCRTVPPSRHLGEPLVGLINFLSPDPLLPLGVGRRSPPKHWSRERWRLYIVMVTGNLVLDLLFGSVSPLRVTPNVCCWHLTADFFA